MDIKLERLGKSLLEEGAELYYEIKNHKERLKFLDWTAGIECVEDEIESLRAELKKDDQIMIGIKVDGSLKGVISIMNIDDVSAELGIWTSIKGVGKKAIQHVINVIRKADEKHNKWKRKKHYTMIYAKVDEQNTACRDMMKKLGFKEYRIYPDFRINKAEGGKRSIILYVYTK